MNNLGLFPFADSVLYVIFVSPKPKTMGKRTYFSDTTIFIMTKYNFSVCKLIFRQNVVLLQSNN